MSRKAHSFLHEYPRIRVDRFTESRERVPDYLKRRNAQEKGPWDDLDIETGEGVATPDTFPHPTIQLLTHIHLDHLEGLNSPLYNSAPIYCSMQTKEMLLRLEFGPSREAGRQGVLMGSRGRKRPYEWLRVTEQEASVRQRETGARIAPRDLLHPLPLNTPTELDYLPGHRIRLTLLDANHMPGAVMFLVEGHRGAVLHTGDCRAEKWWLEALIRNPAMQRYASWEEARAVASRDEIDNDPMLRSQAEELTQTQSVSEGSQTESLSQSFASEANAALRSTVRGDLRLKNIYVDDEAIASAEWPMAKKDGVLELIALMESYPADTNFFFDMWTWGYEEVYIAIGKSFHRKSRGHRVHVDPYKRQMYAAAQDAVSPFLTSKTHTRFHACDRKGDCEFLSAEERRAGEREAFDSLSQQWSGPVVIPPSSSASSDDAAPPPGPMTVYVKPVDSSKRSWKELSARLRQDISQATEGRRPYPRWLACPINRHSALPEIQRFVRAFRPSVVTPTTSHLENHFLAAKYLGPALGPGGNARLEEETRAFIGAKHWDRYERALAGDPDATVADELRRFKEALRQTLDLSQPERGDDGYDADVSGMPTTARQAATCPSSPTLNTASGGGRQSKARATNSEPPTLALPPPQSQLSSSNAVSVDPNASFLASAPPEAATSTTILDDDLARRYFIVLRMFIEPGLRLKNLPGGTEGPQAWRAVRKLRPMLARRTEETMMKEVGVIPPPWTTSAQSSAAPSPAHLPNGDADLAPHEIIRREVKKAVEAEMARRAEAAVAEAEAEATRAVREEGEVGRDASQPAEQQPGSHPGSAPRQSDDDADAQVGDVPVETMAVDDNAACENDGAMMSAPPEANATPTLPLADVPIDADVDWLSSLMAQLQWKGVSDAPSDSEAHAKIVDGDARVYDNIVAAALHFLNAPLLLAAQSGPLIDRLRKCLGAWSFGIQQCPRVVSFHLLLALARQAEAAATLSSLLLTRENRWVVTDQERAALTTVLSNTHEMSLAHEKTLSSGVRSSAHRSAGQPGPFPLLVGLSAEEKYAVQLRIQRIVSILGFALKEGDRTYGRAAGPASPSSSSSRQVALVPMPAHGLPPGQGMKRILVGDGGGGGPTSTTPASLLLQRPYRPPKVLRGIGDENRKNLQF